MKISDQALGAVMMALQKSLMEQVDIVPILREFDFQINQNEELIVTNPPPVHFESEILFDDTEDSEEEKTEVFGDETTSTVGSD